MRHPLKQLGRILAIVAIGTTFASAQEAGLSAEFKLRTGYQVTSQKDHLSHQMYGFGLNMGYGFAFGRFAIEAGWQYKPGTQWLYDSANAYSYAPGFLDAGYGTANAEYSGDSRKNSMDGLTIRLSFEKTFADSAWGIQGGLQIGGTKFRHEFVADITDNSDPAWATATWEETFNGTPSKSYRGISPFLGVHYNLSKDNSIELNVLAVNYKAIEYMHVVGAAPQNSLDYIAEKSRTEPHLELTYTFRF